VKIIEEDIYIPLSSVLRTFKFQGYKFTSSLTRNLPKSGDAKYKTTATYVNFANMFQHLDEYYIGLQEFMRAANTCQIGFNHPLTAVAIKRKADGLFFLSKMLFRPNILIIEVQNRLSRQLRNL